MKRLFLFILYIILLSEGPICLAQDSIQVSDPVLEIRGNTLYIFYEILNSTISEYFTVQVEITDQNEEIINAVSLSGDFGDQVPGGSKNEIIWDFGADSVYLNTDIYVKVYAAKLGEVTSGHEFTRRSLIHQTVALPGLGLSRIREGKPHWLRGVAGYGCVAASVILNRMAISTFKDYKDQITLEDTEALYTRANRQDAFSEALAFTAIAIWVTDLIWIKLTTSGLQETPLYTTSRGLSIGATIEPYSMAPMVGVRYCF
ncbi:MAG: hypothetical protein GY790_15500 [Bacteroidetes bacterium]|nr:hypothetical protein [Bacteroidota bacterium]